MVNRPSVRDRRQSPGEEIANSISHGLGLVGALVAVPVLVIGAMERGTAAGIVGASVFAATMVMVYLTSTLYHALPGERSKRAFQTLDHIAIFLLIAGTYTPFTLGVLRGGWGWTLFGLVWGLCVAGIGLRLIGGLRYPVASLALYIAAGWIAVVVAGPFTVMVPAWGIFWILAGGLAYTGGVAFFRAERLPYNHFVWHLFVMVGTACHFIAVLHFAEHP